MIEAPFTFFEMQVEGMSGHTVELLQPPFGKAPEALDAVNMVRPSYELTFAMFHPIMLGITHIDESIVAMPAIAVDDHFKSHATSNHPLQAGFGADGHHLSVDASVTFQQTCPKGARWCLA